jgi:hypothetical protein
MIIIVIPCHEHKSPIIVVLLIICPSQKESQHINATIKEHNQGK